LWNLWKNCRKRLHILMKLSNKLFVFHKIFHFFFKKPFKLILTFVKKGKKWFSFERINQTYEILNKSWNFSQIYETNFCKERKEMIFFWEDQSNIWDLKQKLKLFTNLWDELAPISQKWERDLRRSKVLTVLIFGIR